MRDLHIRLHVDFGAKINHGTKTGHPILRQALNVHLQIGTIIPQQKTSKRSRKTNGKTVFTDPLAIENNREGPKKDTRPSVAGTPYLCKGEKNKLGISELQSMHQRVTKTEEEVPLSDGFN